MIIGIIRYIKKLSAVIVVSAAVLLSACSKDEGNKQLYVLSSETSVAEWIGATRASLVNEGSITVQSSGLIAENGVVTAGSFALPVASLIYIDRTK
ncbi:hypothetical protein [Pedobacter metabolipauper]|uniref:Uncharacterized protein n=1 Tax=Pedobacter metabolipauper TaxID=425513 RepID=A0A4R6SXS3_9SPHI|nr:hypothetical protein [Pedobacter metabolipauper]TDQ10013.1 hypothetical protein ATK78_2172 [Pedobacter metabolipauper]